MHLYIVVACKTTNCRTAHVLTYLGERGKTPVSVEYGMSYPLMIDCPTCGKTFDYSDSEDMFRQQELLLGPPFEYFNRLALPDFLKTSTTGELKGSLPAVVDHSSSLSCIDSGRQR